MVEIGKSDDVIKKVFLILMLTVIPLAIVVRLWTIITTYWMLILSIFFIGSGLIFFYTYFKGINVGDLLEKIKKLLHTDVPENDVIGQNSQYKIAGNNRMFLWTGMFVEFVGLYLLVRFLANN